MKQYKKTIELWRSYKIEAAADLDKYLDSFRILFAFHSGRIENEEITYHDTREIFENGKVVGFTGSPRTVFEQQNQKLCYEYLKDKIIEKQTLSLALIKEVHQILTSGTYDERRYLANEERPGEFKKHDYVTGMLEVGSPPETVEDDLNQLLEEINDFYGEDILKAGTYFHARFEYIHPFADGNGRVGRTLLNYFLMIRNHPPLIVYDEDKRLYYDGLRQYDEIEDIDMLHQFFRQQTVKTWMRALSEEKDSPAERKKLSDF